MYGFPGGSTGKGSACSAGEVKVKSLSRVRLFATPWTPTRLLPPWNSLGKSTLEWVTIAFSRGSSPPRDQTLVSCIPGRHFNF